MDAHDDGVKKIYRTRSIIARRTKPTKDSVKIPVVTQDMADQAIAKVQGVDLAKVTLGMRKMARQSIQVQNILKAVREKRSARPSL